MSAARGGPVLRLAIGLFVLSFAIALGANAALTLVLEASGAEALPLLTVAHAVLLAAASAAAQRVRDGRHLLTGTLAITTLLVAALALAPPDLRWTRGAFYLVTSVLGDLAMALVWSAASQRFDARAAKRAFPRIGAAGTGGAAIAGLAAPGLSAAFGMQGLVGGLLAALAASIAWSAMEAGGAGAAVRPSTPRNAARRPPSAEDARLLRSIVGGVVVVGAVTLFGRYLYSRALEEAYAGDGVAMASANGLIAGAGSVLTTVVQLVVTPVLLSRFGVRATMAVYPAAMVAAFAALVASFGLATGVLANLAATVLRKGTQAPAEGVLPTALPREHASRAVLLATAVGGPAGMILAGGALHVGRALSPGALAAGGLALAVGLGAITAWRASAYTGALRLRLKKGGSELRLRLAGALADVGDVHELLTQGVEPDAPELAERMRTLARAQREAEREGRRAPVDAAASAWLERVADARLAEAHRLRAALETLPHPTEPPGIDELWRTAIRHRIQEDVEVVLLAVRARTGQADLDRIAPRLFDADAATRAAAVEILEALCPPQVRKLLVPLIEEVGMAGAAAAASRRFGAPSKDPVLDLLEVPDDWLRACTVYALASLGGSAGPQPYRERLSRLGATDDRWLRLAVERALGGGAATRAPSDESAP